MSGKRQSCWPPHDNPLDDASSQKQVGHHLEPRQRKNPHSRQYIGRSILVGGGEVAGGLQWFQGGLWKCMTMAYIRAYREVARRVHKRVLFF